MTNSERVDRLPCDGTAGDKKRIGGGTQTGGRPEPPSGGEPDG
jgi:hypothetical protein